MTCTNVDARLFKRQCRRTIASLRPPRALHVVVLRGGGGGGGGDDVNMHN